MYTFETLVSDTDYVAPFANGGECILGLIGRAYYCDIGWPKDAIKYFLTYERHNMTEELIELMESI